MKNTKFDISFDPDTGTIKSIVHPDDIHSMNWCTEGGKWGMVNYTDILERHRPDKYIADALTLKSFSETDISSESLYSCGRLEVTVKRQFCPDGNFTEKYVIKNISDTVMCINRDNFGIELPLNDKYTYADECMTNRCNAHIWCGLSTTWINALKMGESDINLGLVLTQGAIQSYSTVNTAYSAEGLYRGVFVMNPESITLCSGEEYVLEWELFWHTGKDDFADTIRNRKNIITVDAKHYTVFEDEPILFSAYVGEASDVSVRCGNEEIEFASKGDVIEASYHPERSGDYRIEIRADNRRTFAEFAVRPALAELIERRINFIVSNQQCLDSKSPLYGAYLIYDNKLGSTYFNDAIPDHNACRERIGMALLICRYLRTHADQRIRDSFDLFLNFVYREFYDEETGEVFNTIGKNRDMIRLYNAPWLMMLFGEVYFLTGDKKYLADIMKLADNYYALGGKKFYPNGIEISGIIAAFRHAGMAKEEQKLFEYFRLHVANMISNSLSYPKHEVNYEQTIVTPAVTFVSQMGELLPDDKSYLAEAKKHVRILERFSGHQPSFHLNEIPIRYWDDFWFGKSQVLGDTFPHYWSCLTARAYVCYNKLSGDSKYLNAAVRCMRNCMCLFDEKGTGSCAYVYPYKVDGRECGFYDDWANDQDFALYFAMTFDML